MKSRRTLLTLGFAVALLVAGLVVAANMGFKHVADFSVAGRDYWVSVPYKNHYGVAQDVCEDVGPNAILVSRFDTPTEVRQDWTCPFGNNFPITSGEGLFLRVDEPTTPIISGSHDPDLAIPVGGFTVANEDWFLSIPYHHVAANASDLCDEIGPTVTLVSRYDTGTGYRQDWVCPLGTNFPIRDGEAVAVRVSVPTSAFVPEHY
jgi:hypothetical protein